MVKGDSRVAHLVLEAFSRGDIILSRDIIESRDIILSRDIIESKDIIQPRVIIGHGAEVVLMMTESTGVAPEAWRSCGILPAYDASLYCKKHNTDRCNHASHVSRPE